MSASDQKTPAERDETPLERVDRNTIELLNELRVAGSGVQVLFAFLLIVPFNTGYKRLTSVDRYIYVATLVSIAMAAALLIAPSVHFRIHRRRHRQQGAGPGGRVGDCLKDLG